MNNTMTTKDLAYSLEELKILLMKVEGIVYIEDKIYAYKNAQILLEENTHQKTMHTNEKYLIPKFSRSFMFLSGDENDIDEFYKKFMVYCMTMGG